MSEKADELPVEDDMPSPGWQDVERTRSASAYVGPAVLGSFALLGALAGGIGSAVHAPEAIVQEWYVGSIGSAIGSVAGAAYVRFRLHRHLPTSDSGGRTVR